MKQNFENGRQILYHKSIWKGGDHSKSEVEITQSKLVLGKLASEINNKFKIKRGKSVIIISSRGGDRSKQNCLII